MTKNQSERISILFTEEKGGTEFKVSVLKSVTPVNHITTPEFDKALKWFQARLTEYNNKSEPVSVMIHTRFVKITSAPEFYIDTEGTRHDFNGSVGIKVGNIYKTNHVLTVNHVSVFDDIGMEITLPNECLQPAAKEFEEAAEPITPLLNEIYRQKPLLPGEGWNLPEYEIVGNDATFPDTPPGAKSYIRTEANLNIVQVTPAFANLPGYLQYFFIRWAYHRFLLEEQVKFTNSIYNDSRADILALSDCITKNLPLKSICKFMITEFLNPIGTTSANDRIGAIVAFEELVRESFWKTIKDTDLAIKVKCINGFSPETIYVSKKMEETFPISLDGDTIMLNRPIKVDMRNYKNCGSNNVFDVYNLKRGSTNAL
jgi:hypothetical protein